MSEAGWPAQLALILAMFTAVVEHPRLSWSMRSCCTPHVTGQSCGHGTFPQTRTPCSLRRKGERQLGNLGAVTAESFQIGPGVAEDAIALAEEIAAFHERFVR